jgi:hypothetical protein
MWLRLPQLPFSGFDWGVKSGFLHFHRHFPCQVCKENLSKGVLGAVLSSFHTHTMKTSSSSSSPLRLGVLATLLAHTAVLALDNGLGQAPETGMNTWYATHQHLTYPNYTWMPGYVLSEDVKSMVTWMSSNGFRNISKPIYASNSNTVTGWEPFGPDLYSYANLDDCIVVGRDSNGELIPDPQAFPQGVEPVVQWMAAQNPPWKLGWYSDRGNYTCSCWAGGLKRPGSRGYEEVDAQTYAKWGVTYLKEDRLVFICVKQRERERKQQRYPKRYIRILLHGMLTHFFSFSLCLSLSLSFFFFFFLLCHQLL